jgi:glycosyltransferase involved in cell wall biosynthesis
MKKMKVALVHDWLTGQRGGEKVLEVLAEIFPEAPIYTLFHLRGSQSPAIEGRIIRTSFLQGFPFLKKHYRWYLPLFPLAAELFDLREFDLVVSSSHCVAKGVITRPDAVHVSYIHTPVRYAWGQYHDYFGPGRLSVLARPVIPLLIHGLRLWDEASAARVDRFIANSGNVARRIRKYYRRGAEVVFPPVDADFFTPAAGQARGDEYLVVSALVPYKRIDLAVAACNDAGRKLFIVGDGPEAPALRKMAGPSIRFVPFLPAEDLRQAYREARALLMPGEEDFGIAALEAQACGTPVLAYGRGGALETVRPGRTGLFFEDQTASGLAAALDKFDRFVCNKSAARSNALRFSRQAFKRRLAGVLRRAVASPTGSIGPKA